MVTVHPECIGRGHRMAMLERFIDAAAALDGVVFERLDSSSSNGSIRSSAAGRQRIPDYRGDRSIE
jgi:hypothetical protein